MRGRESNLEQNPPREHMKTAPANRSIEFNTSRGNFQVASIECFVLVCLNVFVDVFDIANKNCSSLRDRFERSFRFHIHPMHSMNRENRNNSNEYTKKNKKRKKKKI